MYSEVAAGLGTLLLLQLGHALALASTGHFVRTRCDSASVLTASSGSGLQLTTSSKTHCSSMCLSMSWCGAFTYNNNNNNNMACTGLNATQLKAAVSGGVDVYVEQSHLPLPKQTAPETGQKVFMQSTGSSKWVRLPSLASNGTTCSAPPTLLSQTSFATGAVINGRATICGGQLPNGTYLSDCSSLDPASNAWVPFPGLPYSVTYASSLMTAYGWWISGGLSGSSAVSKSILFDLTQNAWKSGPNLTIPTYKHCLAAINSTHYFMASGAGSPDAWILNWPANAWTPVQTWNPSIGIYYYGCLLYSLGGSPCIVMAGGGTNNAFAFFLGNMSWAQLPNLPIAVSDPTLLLDGSRLVMLGLSANRTLIFDDVSRTFSVVPNASSLTKLGGTAAFPINDTALNNCA